VKNEPDNISYSVKYLIKLRVRRIRPNVVINGLQTLFYIFIHTVRNARLKSTSSFDFKYVAYAYLATKPLYVMVIFID
jgi:hypothetical protein